MILLNAEQLKKLTNQRLRAYRKAVRNRLSFYTNGAGTCTTPQEKRIDQLNAAMELLIKETTARRLPRKGTKAAIEFLLDIYEGSGDIVQLSTRPLSKCATMSRVCERMGTRIGANKRDIT